MRRRLVTRKQDELLYALVRAARCLDLPEPVEFRLVEPSSGEAKSRITHPCLPEGQISAARTDVEALIRKGLLRQSNTVGEGMAFDIDPRGFEVFRQKARAEHRPVPRMGISARAHMDGSSFEQAYPIAYDKWAQAEALLPADDPTPTGQSVYQLCSEALLAFAGYLEVKFDLDDPKRVGAPAHERIQVLLDSNEMGVDSADRLFLTALLSNWHNLLDRVQSQGENAPPEDGALHWQDLHLAVFHTAVVMFEIDRSLSRNR